MLGGEETTGLAQSVAPELFPRTSAGDLSATAPGWLIFFVNHEGREEHERCVELEPRRTRRARSFMKFDSLSNRVIGCAIEVHRELGPGLLESAYEQCLAHELKLGGIQFDRQKNLPVEYKGQKIDCGYRIDLLVEGQLILELKCVDALTSVHQAQLMTYMKLAKIKTGFLINFNVSLLKNGLKRFVL